MKKLLVIEIMMFLQLVPQGVLLCYMPLLPLLFSDFFDVHFVCTGVLISP